MAKTKDEKDRRTNRLMVSLTDAENFQLTRLAKVVNKPTAVVVREILTDYLDVHKDEIDEADRAADAYHASLKNLRPRQTMLFALEDS